MVFVLIVLIFHLANDYGWKPQVQNRSTGVKRPFKEKTEKGSVRFPFRLWTMLNEYGVVKDPSREACNVWVRKHFDVPAEWLDDELLVRHSSLKFWGFKAARQRNDENMLEDFKKAL